MIGLGNIGREHIKNLQSGAIGDVSVVAACSRSERPADLDQSIDHYQDYEQMLVDVRPDAVIVATPTKDHKQQAIDVLNAGCHLLMEKPAGMNVLEADALQKISLQPGQQFAVMLNQRYDPVYQRIKSLLTENLLGPIQRISWTLTHWYRPDIYYRVSEWRGTWQGEGGGVLMNQCIHNLDIFYWLFGMPTTVYAECQFGRYHDIEVEDEVTAVMSFGSGTRATFISSTGEAPGINQLDIVGEKGSLRYDGSQLVHQLLDQATPEHSASTKDMFSMPAVKESIVPIEPGINQHMQLTLDFIDAIKGRIALPTGLGEAVHSIELANGMLLSSWLNRRVDLPLDRQSFEQQFAKKLANSTLREKESLDVNIDMSSSYR